MHHTSIHKIEGFLATKLMITLLENMRGGPLDQSLQNIIGMCIQEFDILNNRQKQY